MGKLRVRGQHGVRAAHQMLHALGVINTAGCVIIGDGLAALFHLGVGVRNGRQQALGVGVHGMGEDFLLGAGLHHVAQVQHADAVGNILDHAQIVRNKQVRAARFLLDVLHQVDHLCLDGYVQGADGLVGDQQVGMHDDRARDADALLLAAGEFMRVATGMLAGKPHQLQNFIDLLIQVFLIADTVDDQPLGDDFLYRHAGVEGGDRILEDHLDLGDQLGFLGDAQILAVLLLQRFGLLGGLGLFQILGIFGVQLRDPSQRYPIFRAESLPRFERLLAADERNAHFLPAAETALRNIVLDLSASASEQREPAPEQPAAENFRITDEHLGEGSAKAKFSANIEAISVLKMVESEHRSALPQEQEVLSRYVGWGGLPQAFDEHSEAWRSEYSALKSLLTQEEYEAARASTLNAHYTSPTVIRAIYAAVEQLGFRSGNVLEPSCGVGNFFGMLPDSMKESRLYGVELDSITGRIAQQLYPKAHITIAGFETTDRRDFFDLAIGNVPFGAYQVQDKAFARHNFLIHDYFFGATRS